MVKSVLGVNHQGFRDWAIQRLSAIIMIVYSLALFSYFLTHSPLSYTEWHALFANQWMKVATLLVLFAVLHHAWIGMWTIFTDYIKPFVLRAIINTIVLLMLFALFIWGFLIVWGV